MGEELPFPFHPSGDVRNEAGCAERERKKNLKMGKAALVKHLSAAWFLQTELGELRVQQPRELHARLMLTAIPQPKCTFQFCMSGWQICKTNDALLRRRPIGTCLGCHAEPGHSPGSRSLRQMARSPPVWLSPPMGKNARLKKSISVAHTQPVLRAFAASPRLGWPLCA